MISDHKSLTFRIRRSFFFKTPNRSDHQRDRRFLLKNLVLHFRPRTVPERTLKFTLSWGLGGTALVLVFLLAATGVMLRFVYIPVPDQAYESIQALQHEIRFGQLIRNIHHWSGNILVLVSFLHLLRIFFSGAFHPPRQLNWVIGICLFVLILISNFTGYLLPWDQLAFWAITICTGMVEYVPGIGLWLQKMMRGGAEINPATLSNFFAIHTAVLPLCMLLCLPFHFWRIRKAGGLVVPRTIDEPIEKIGERVATVPNLLLRELVVALVVFAFVLILSVLVNAPLEEKANPGVSPNPTKAPWYFMGLQELLLHFHPVVAVLVIPALTMMVLLGLPYISYDSNTSGIWFSSPKGRRLAVKSALVAAAVIPFAILVDEYFIDFTAWLPAIPVVISNGLIPFGLLLTVLIGSYYFLKYKFAASVNEAIQAIFAALIVAFIVLSATGIWFRGKGMALVWPWNLGGY